MIYHKIPELEFVVVFYDGSTKTYDNLEQVWKSGYAQHATHKGFKPTCARPGCTARSLKYAELHHECVVRDKVYDWDTNRWHFFHTATGYSHDVVCQPIIRDEFGKVYDVWELRELYHHNYPPTHHPFPMFDWNHHKHARPTSQLSKRLGYQPKYYRNPSTTNEKRQYENTQDYQLKVHVRGKRRPAQLVDTWSDLVNQTNYQKSWKIRKLRKQWMVNL